MSWKYALQYSSPYPVRKGFKWVDIALSNNKEVLISQLLPYNRVVERETRKVIVEHELLR